MNVVKTYADMYVADLHENVEKRKANDRRYEVKKQLSFPKVDLADEDTTNINTSNDHSEKEVSSCPLSTWHI